MRSLIITEKDAGQRLDKLLGKYLNLAGKSFIYKNATVQRNYPVVMK